MLRARFPLAVALLVAAVALGPATSASAASGTPSLPGLPSQVQDALDQLGSAGGGSGAPDVGGALTDLTGCLASTPTATPTPTPTPTSTATTSTSTPTSTATTNSTRQSVDSGEAPASTQSTKPTPAPGDNPLQGLTGQSASGATVLAAGALDPISNPVDAGQQCLQDFLAGLGATQAKCFSANNFTLGYLTDKLGQGLAGEPPSEADIKEFQTNLTGLLACLSAPPTTSETPDPPADTTPTEAPAAVGDEAPAAVAVLGTPNFTG